jgi:hypothetical protein
LNSSRVLLKIMMATTEPRCSRSLR